MSSPNLASALAASSCAPGVCAYAAAWASFVVIFGREDGARGGGRGAFLAGVDPGATAEDDAAEGEKGGGT